MNFICKENKYLQDGVANKEELIPKSKISGDWPAVRLVVSSSKNILADEFARTIEGFKSHKIIQDYSDCVLLIHSTKETKTWAGLYAQALENKGIPVYNPRARQFLEEEEVKLALGALLSVLDEKKNYLMVSQWIQEKCESWREFYSCSMGKHKGLASYVEKSKKAIAKTKKEVYFKSTLQDIFYHIINQEPFTGWCEDLERAVRIGYLTSVVEAYCSTPIPGHPGVNRGSLQASKENDGEISLWWRSQFYNAFVALLAEQGLNDPEDEDRIFPKGKVPFMTVHQAKGLEFPVVFVARMDEEAEPGSEHIVEDELNQFRKNKIAASDVRQKAREDLIRFYYVAYSRARYALVLLLEADNITPGEGKDEFISLGGKNLSWLRNEIGISEI
jgi:DNA helicase II / ATP-dependent DNA helicase PcrA